MHYRDALGEIEAGRFRPVYLVYGGEAFLTEEVFHALRTALVQPETADFNYHVLDQSPDQVRQALTLAQTQPFFAERRLVVVKECAALTPRRKAGDDGGEEGPPEESDEALLSYLKKPVSSTVLLFLNASVDARRKVTKALIASGCAVECQPLKGEDAVMWVQQRAQSKGKKLGAPAANLLVERIGADLQLLDSELEKLVLFAGPAREIRPGDVEQMVSNMAETEIYRLTEAVVRKDRTRTLLLLDRVLRQVDHPLQVLAALTNRFRQLLLVKSLAARGLSRKDGAAAAHMHPYAYEKVVGQAAAVDRGQIVAALERLLEADLAMKSGFDPRLTLETVVVELLGG